MITACLTGKMQYTKWANYLSKNLHNAPASKIYNNMQICSVIYCRTKSVIINLQLYNLCFEIQLIIDSVEGYYTTSRVEAQHELRSFIWWEAQSQAGRGKMNFSSYWIRLIRILAWVAWYDK